MNNARRFEQASKYLEMEDSKSFNGVRALAFRALMCHLKHGQPSLATVLVLAKECGVQDFAMFERLE